MNLFIPLPIKKISSFLCYSFWAGFVLLLAVSCGTTDREEPFTLRQTQAESRTMADEIEESTSLELAKGLILRVWATDSLAPDPIAIDVDDVGRVYLTRAVRQKNSEFDIRGHRDWMTASISFQSVEDRRAFLRSTFAPEKSAQNEWLEDLNNDGSHDWKDLTVEQDEIWQIEDRDNDGLADVSSRIFKGINEEVTDVAGALLVDGEDIFLGTGPDMWRLNDTNEDGVFDQLTSISHGYAVHIGFGAHGMSGAIKGPDGKIYWGIGDIGANITAKNGTNYKYPNQGVIVRSDRDGSNFEVFSAGHRNTHEFVFDEYGNIISVDNDGDHPGESERLVHIVEGYDAGWRINWQFGKYTDPKNNNYKVWMDEKYYLPRWEGQAAHILPPIRNYHNGPTGMAYNPGTALGTRWLNKFFVVEFVGNPSNSPLWSFSLKPKGASFAFESETMVVRGILPTGIEFGPDGALYVADWVNGWKSKDYGRVWKMDVSENTNDLADQRKETQRLMELNYAKQSGDELLGLLHYPDMRIRSKAQFELVKKGKPGSMVMKSAINQKQNQLARIHGIWGLGQLAASDSAYARHLLVLLNDEDPEIIAQSAKVIGDVFYQPAGPLLIPLLDSEQSRVRFFAAQALGRMQYEGAVAALIEMIRQNNDEDLYIRHAGVLALSRIGKIDPLLALVNHESKALRTAAVLALRRLGNEHVALFLNDPDEYVVTEAARAINDDWSIVPALPALAEVLKEDRFTSEPLLRRAINAALRVGGEKEMDLLINFARRQNVDPVLREEALATLATWPNPSELDRVDGRYRGKIVRDPEPLKLKVKDHLGAFLSVNDDLVLIEAIQMVKHLGFQDQFPRLNGLQRNHQSPDVRAASLDALAALNYPGIEPAIQRGMKDPAMEVRMKSVELLPLLTTDKESLTRIVSPIFAVGSLEEQQQLIQTLGKMPLSKTSETFGELINRMINKELDPGIHLDLTEAITATGSDSLQMLLDKVPKGENIFEAFAGTLYGGNVETGRRFFRNNSAGQCSRCHSIEEQEGLVGPALSGIGSKLSREQLLEALIAPSERLAPGFGTVTLTLTDGQKVSGILMKESAEELILKTGEAEPLEVPVSRITNRTNLPSSMPPMGTVMSKKEIRDVIAFLASLED